MRILGVIALVALSLTRAGAQSTGRISGVASDAASGAPLRADISIEPPRRFVRADSAGRFTFAAVVAGLVTLRARAFGYEPRDTVVAVRPNEETTVSMALRASPRTLGAVRTVAKAPERQRFEESTSPSVLSVSAAELRHVPTIGDRDVLRAATLLPGVIARNDFSAGYNVRGGEADQNLVLLDGAPIYNPFHLGGLFGTFIDAAVSNVDVLTGGFPAEYGGRLSSVLDVTSTEEPRRGVHGGAEVSLLSSSALLGGSLGSGRTSWNLAGRRTYADKVVKAIRGSDDFPYHFQDAQFHARTMFGGGGALSLTAYIGKDLLYEPADDTGPNGERDDEPVSFDWGNQVVGLSFNQPLGQRTTFVQQLAYSRFATHFDAPHDSVRLSQGVEETRLAGRLTHLHGAHTFAAGYEGSWYHTGYREQLPFFDEDFEFPDPLATDGDTTMIQRGAAFALFADDRWKPNDRLIVRPGLRAEYVSGAGWFGISPRLSARYFITPNLAVTAAAGRYSQWMRAMRNEDLPFRVFDLWVASDKQVPVSTSNHLVLGMERWMSTSRFLRVEAYGKSYDKLSEPASAIDPRIRPSLLRYFDGRSYGVDVYLRQLERNGFGGWLAYSYGVSTRSREGASYFPAHDRRHNANLIMSYAPGARYALGARLGVASGTPYTGWAGVMNRLRYDPIGHVWVRDPFTDADEVHGQRNAERFPLYWRADLSFERRFNVGRATLHPYLDFVNIFNAKNVFLYTLDSDVQPPRISGVSQFPFLPSFGLRVTF